MAGAEARADTVKGDPTPPDDGERAIIELRTRLNDKRKGGFRENYIDAQTKKRKGEQDKNAIEKELDQIAEELERRKSDQDFQDALAVWGRTRNTAEETGSDGQGFHAGIVHYFGYRASASKTQRYIGGEHEKPSIQGFIDFSRELKELIDNPNPSQNPQIIDVVRLGDERGQSRLRVLTQNHVLVVGFQRAGDTTRVLTAVPNISESKFHKYITEERRTRPEDDPRFNKLGQVREPVPLVQV